MTLSARYVIDAEGSVNRRGRRNKSHCSGIRTYGSYRVRQPYLKVEVCFRRRNMRPPARAEQLP